MTRSRTALVITSISGPNAVLHSFAEGCKAHDIRFLLIGDRPSPAGFSLDGCEFWSLERQLRMPFTLAALLPERHYARKNLGYLEAIGQGATVIIESDDDNFPLDGFWIERTPDRSAARFERCGWLNVYRMFTKKRVWPRGFPLERLNDTAPFLSSPMQVRSPIQQGLANTHPDVDAIYRLTDGSPVEFDEREGPVSLGPGAWCPFNSQNTTFFEEAFPLLYLPSYCSFRMTDIWRSFIALRIAWENGWDVLFHNATVRQERNVHDLLKDFTDEVPGYTNNALICERLAELRLEAGAEHIAANMDRCYAEFITMGLIDPAEQRLLKAWHRDLEALRSS